MITGMLLFGGGLTIRRNIVLSAALILGAASAVAAASPGDLQQASALCIPAAPFGLVPEQGSWGNNNGLSIWSFGAGAQPIPYLAETAKWLSRSLGTGTLTSDLFDPTQMTSNASAFSRGPLAQPPAGSFTIPPATVGSGYPAHP